MKYVSFGKSFLGNSKKTYLKRLFSSYLICQSRFIEMSYKRAYYSSRDKGFKMNHVITRQEIAFETILYVTVIF